MKERLRIFGTPSCCPPVTSFLWTSRKTTYGHYPADNLKAYSTKCITFQLFMQTQTDTCIFVYMQNMLKHACIYVQQNIHICLLINIYDRSGARLTKAYDVTIQRYRNSHAKIHDSKMHILRCLGSKFCVKFQRCPLKFHTKFWTHTPQNMHFMRWWKFGDLWYLRVMTS